MKKIASVLLSVALILSLIVTNGQNVCAAETTSAVGTTYYVDAQNGSDTNAGTSEASAWRSLDKVNTTTFQPGDKLLFKSGCSWHGQLFPKGSGSEGAPIIIDKYGNDANLPSINGDGAQRQFHKTGAVLLCNQQYWEINNLEVTNDNDFNTDLVSTTYDSSTHTPSNIRDGILITVNTDTIPQGQNGIMNHIYVSNCYVHNVDSPDEWPNTYGNAAFNGGIMFYVYGSLKSSMSFNDVRIENNTIKTCDLLGIANFNYTTATDFQDEIGPQNLWQTNIYIGHNYMQDIAQGGIDLCDAKDALCEYNILDGWSKRYNAQSAGIYPWKSMNVVFQHNEVYGGPTHTDSSNGDGTAFDFDSPNINIVYQYNYSHNNPMGWMSYLGRSSNNIARYNISDDGGSYLIKFGWFDVDTDPTYFANNVFVYNGSQTAFTNANSRLGDYFKNVAYYFYNNVFYDKTGPGSGTWPTSSSYGTAVFRNNCFYSTNGVHKSGEPADSAKITTNPQFVNPGQEPTRDASGRISGATIWDGYKLQSTSPLIDQGISSICMGDKDFYGTTLQYGNAPDIGVQEVVQGSYVTPTPVDPQPLVNYASGLTAKMIRADGTQVNDSSVTDGSMGSYFTSATLSPFTAELDFGKVVTFNEITACEYTTTPPASGNYKPFSPSIKNYNYQYWNGSAWVDFYASQKIGASKTDDFVTVTAQKIRMNIQSCTDAVHLAEIKVYNNPQATPSTGGQDDPVPDPVSFNVIAHYTFDNVSGTTVPDASANARNASISSSVSVSSSGKFGSALYFGANGTVKTGYLSVPNSAALNTSEYTISMWVKPDAYSLSASNDAIQLYSKGPNVGECYSSTIVTTNVWGEAVGGFQDPMILATSSGTKGARWCPTTEGSADSTLKVPEGVWSNIVHTYDEHTYNIYVNGVLVKSVPVSDNATAARLYMNTSNLLFGNQSTSGMHPYYGYMDDVLILDNAVSSQQVSDIYSNQLLP